MQDRVFGKEIDNLVHNNHIVLKSRSYSFQNKQKSLVNGSSLQPNIIRRCSMISGARRINNNNLSINAQNNLQKYNVDRSNVIKDAVEPTLQEKIATMSADIQLTCEYMKEWVTTKIQSEKKNYQILQNNQQKINRVSSERTSTVDWMVAVHYQLKLFPETLFIAINYMDTYLAKGDVKPADIQFEKLAIACFLLAGKYEQTYRIPCVKSLLQFAKQTLNKNDILEMQAKVIETLQLEFICETSSSYLDLFAKVCQISPKNKFIARYILELALLDNGFMEFTPSILASSVVYLVHKIRKIGMVWPKFMVELTQYQESDLRHCAKRLCTLLQKSPNMQTGKRIKKKYSSTQFFEAARIRLQRKAQ